MSFRANDIEDNTYEESRADIIEYQSANDMYPEIRDQYADEYLEAEMLGASFDLLVGECDLNDDGQTDYVVILYSVLYGGSHGHYTEALIANPNGDRMTRMGVGIGFEPRILDSKTNGLHDLAFPENPNGVFKYDGEKSYIYEVTQ
jgi:hypothetical protein